MKIAVIGATERLPQQGGTEHYCAELYSRIAAQGHQVDVFARSSWTHLPAFDRQDDCGVRVILLPCPSWRGSDAMFSAALGAAIATQKQYDIVHFHTLGSALFSGLPKLNGRSKVVVTCQGLDWQRDQWSKFSSQLIRWGEKAAVKFADSIVVVSEALRTYFLETYEQPALYVPNTFTSYPAADPTFRYGASLGLEQQQYLICLGQLVPENCPDLLIEAFQKIAPQGYKLVFVGDDRESSQFVQQLKQLAQWHDNIVFAGEQQGARLTELVRNAGLFVSPSASEGLPRAILEGMLSGIPIVASNILPHRQLLGRDRGLLFTAGDRVDCATALNWAIHHVDVMKQYAAQAQQQVQCYYTWEQITEAHLKLYASLLKMPQTVPVKLRS